MLEDSPNFAEVFKKACANFCEQVKDVEKKFTESLAEIHGESPDPEYRAPEHDPAFVGRHLILDVEIRDPGKPLPKILFDVGQVYNLFEKISKRIGMTLVSPPYVARFPWAASELQRFVEKIKREAHNIQSGTVALMEETLRRRQQEDSGITGFAVWLESHCSFHSWPEESFFSMDLFSCKDFDPDAAIDEITSKLSGWSYFISCLDIVRMIGKPAIVGRFQMDQGGRLDGQ